MFKKFEIERVPKSENRQADALSKLTNSPQDGYLKSIHWKISIEWTINTKGLVWIDRSEIWIEPLMSHLHEKTLPQDPKEANRIKKRSKWFLLYEMLIYKKSFFHSLLRCTASQEGKRILIEIHEGECGSHIRG